MQNAKLIFKQIAMSIFSRKKAINLEDFCRDFYDNQILNPVIGGVDVGSAFSDVVIREIVEVDQSFADTDKRKLTNELTIIRFELFALAWSHKFISGKNVVTQSDFTKHYLREKGRDDIWNGMEPYNKVIDGATLRWLTDLGKINLSFNYNMRESLTAKNIEVAKELGMDINDTIERVNNRLWSENAWKQHLLAGPLVYAFCERIGINARNLNKEAKVRIAVVIRGLYEGAQQSWDKVKIKN